MALAHYFDKVSTVVGILLITLWPLAVSAWCSLGLFTALAMLFMISLRAA